jgi:hypothetical protein
VSRDEIQYGHCKNSAKWKSDEHAHLIYDKVIMWQVIDGLFNKDQMNSIEKYTLSELLFKFHPNTSGLDEDELDGSFEYFETPQFTAPIQHDCKIGLKIIDIITNFLDIGCNKVKRIKCNLQFPQLEYSDYKFHHPHIDCHPLDTSMISMIYYVNNSDGPTYIFRSDKEIEEKVEPKRGRVLLMSAYQFHSSTFPMKTNMRNIINFNFYPKKKVVWPTHGNEYQTVVEEQDGPAPCP